MSAYADPRPGRSQSLGQVGRAILPLYLARRLPLVAAVACYFDESFDVEVHVVAGYVALVETWDESFAPEWNEEIGKATKRIREFKAGDCRQGNGEFKNWTRAERDRLTRSLVNVICHNRILAGFAAAVVFPGIGRSRKDRAAVEQIAYGIGIGMCFCRCLSVLTKIGAELDRSGLRVRIGQDEIQLFMDHREGFYKRALSNFEFAKKYVGEHLCASIPPPAPGNSLKTPALQAADLLAYEVRKEVRNRMQRRGVSVALERLLSAHPHVSVCLHGPDLEEYNRSAKANEVPRFHEKRLLGTHVARPPGSWLVPPE